MVLPNVRRGNVERVGVSFSDIPTVAFTSLSIAPDAFVRARGAAGCARNP
ncbi:MAG: hypothetical protein ACR2PI_19245 [Hyphomicrobiaceae bacterium]